MIPGSSLVVLRFQIVANYLAKLYFVVMKLILIGISMISS